MPFFFFFLLWSSLNFPDITEETFKHKKKINKHQRIYKCLAYLFAADDFQARKTMHNHYENILIHLVIYKLYYLQIR